MRELTKVTDNLNETCAYDVFVKPNQLSVPLFQREYVWKKVQWERMDREITRIITTEDNSRFLGAVIAVSRQTNPAHPSTLEIVDGQQRLTTLYLVILAAISVAADNGHTDEAGAWAAQYTFLAFHKGGPNLRVLPSYADRHQLVTIFNTLRSKPGLGDFFKDLSLPPATGAAGGPLANQFALIEKSLRRVYKVNKSIVDLSEYLHVSIRGLTFVFIVLKDASTATTVFEGLNNPGVPITTGDLVRNEVFAKMGDDPVKAHELHLNRWRPFQDKFTARDLSGEGHFDKFFFPFTLIHDPAAKTSDMFRTLRQRWQNVRAEDIISELELYASPYLALAAAAIGPDYDREVQAKLQQLAILQPPAAVLSFGMRLLRSYLNDETSREDTVGALAVVESFLFRRAACGIEPTGLLAVFRNLWAAIDGTVQASSVAAALRRRTTVEWPDDTRFAEAVRSRGIYGTSHCRYALLMYDRSLGGDAPTNVEWQVEHILPQSLSPTWAKKFSSEQHKQLLNTWANLVPVSGSMNAELGRTDFESKVERYRADSMYKSTRALAAETDWNPDAVTRRAERLAEWALKRWPSFG